ncbi:MAG: LLM class F420-dependent oxidoreductase [Anaerolineae bacterium]
MRFDITSFPNDLKTVASLGEKIEKLGFDALWTAEAAHNPFLPLTLVANATTRLTLGTQIAVAFARSPMTVANIAWDLQAQSDGRFILGLGTQVKAHIQKRFSMTWDSPLPRLREYIEGLRAIWDTWQNDTPLRYEGEYYTFKLMTPFFNPGPIAHPHIPIYIAGVNEHICRLAGELCNGLHAHGFHTVKYLRELVQANIDAGLAKSGRSRDQFELVVPIFTVTGRDDAEMEKNIIATKARIAFYASTPTYQSVLETHGWQDTGEKLSSMARQGQWEAMWEQISDEMLHEIAVVGTPDELPAKVHTRYAGVADRICFGWDIDDPAGDFYLETLSKIQALA